MDFYLPTGVLCSSFAAPSICFATEAQSEADLDTKIDFRLWNITELCAFQILHVCHKR